MKESLEKFFEEEKEKITQYLDISSQSIIEDKFNIENLKISQGKRDNFYFDLNLFIKYILLLGLIFGIAIIDFLLVQHIVVEEFNLERNADKTLVFLVHYIIPFLPSFVLIFGEFLVLKYLKQKKFLKKVVHTFATIIVLIVVFSVFVTINGTQVQFIEPIIFV